MILIIALSFLGLIALFALMCVIVVFNEHKMGKYRNNYMKVLPTIDIPDGEFLHYTNYVNKEKYADFYLVTKKESSPSGALLYRAYIDIVTVTEDRTISRDYTKWPINLLMDPKIGSAIEMETTLQSDVLKHWVLKNIVYMKYSLDTVRHEMSFVYRTLKGGKTKTIHKKTKMLHSFANSDLFFSLFYSERMLQLKWGDYIKFFVPPYFMMTNYTTKMFGEQKRSVPAGDFTTVKNQAFVRFSIFFKDVLVPLRGYESFAEISDKRIVVEKTTIAGNINTFILNKISNINLPDFSVKG